MKQQGFSLIELMIAVSIVAILAAIALPMVSDNALKGRRAIAKSQLMEVQSKQEEFFINNKVYATTLAELGYPSPLYIDDNVYNASNPVTLAKSFYQISIVAANLSYTITATPKNAQGGDADCAVLSVTNTGAKGATGTKGSAGCW